MRSHACVYMCAVPFSAEWLAVLSLVCDAGGAGSGGTISVRYPHVSPDALF